MSLAFLAKKSWHTSNLKNVEKVWIAEQKHAQEEKKLAELKKQIEEERQVQELRELQAKAGNSKALQKRVDWMYDGPMAHAAKSSTEDYLLGKEFKGDLEATTEVKQNEQNPGALWLNQTSASNDSFSRLHEDPMLMIRERQQKSQKDILNNPVKMKRIKERVEGELRERKKKKKAKKEAKKEAKRERKRMKKEGRRDREERSRSRSRIKHRRSNSASASPETRGRSRERESRDKIGRDTRERRSYHREKSAQESSRARGRHKRSYSRSRSPKRHRSRTPDRHFRRRKRYASRSTSPYRDGSHRRKSEADEEIHSHKFPVKELSSSRKGGADDKYGLRNMENASKCRDLDETSLGPNGKFLQKARESKKKEEQERMERFSKARRVLTDAEKQEMLKEMMQDATHREKHAIYRTSKPAESDELSSKQRNPDFLSSMRSEVYLNANEDMEDRLCRNKHYIQKNASASNFMRRA